MCLPFGPEATNLFAISSEVPVDLINSWFEGAVGGAEGSGTAVMSTAVLRKYIGSDNFSAVLMSTVGSGRSVGVRDCNMKGIKTSLAFALWEIERKVIEVWDMTNISGNVGLGIVLRRDHFFTGSDEGKEERTKGLKERGWRHLNEWKRNSWTLTHCGTLLCVPEIRLLLAYVQYFKDLQDKLGSIISAKESHWKYVFR